ncbi:MAG: TIGR03013 family PEP-CTERM/XrtA system glycosyltransferase [Candidatus Competibacteraceae bacterium]|nr:TIGR03013 family PEP-CTERM/XrtA system glycosyltransferase [Candidatus Competibacteraceae bacterium]
MDALVVFAAFACGPRVWNAWPGGAAPAPPPALAAALAATVPLMAILVAMGVYEPKFWRGRGDWLLRVGVGFLFGLFALSLLRWWFPLAPDRGPTYRALLWAGAGMAALRWGFSRLARRPAFERRVLVLGVGRQAARVASGWSPLSGARLLGFVRAHEGETPEIPAARELRAAGRLLDLAEGLRADEIVVALDDRRRGFPCEELMECKLAGIAVWSALAFAERETGQIALDALRPSGFLFAGGYPALLGRPLSKRGTDLVGGAVLLVLSAPLFLLAALAVGIESGFREPIFYRQLRVGRNGRPFWIFKFRTMRAGAEREGLARPGDPRITRAGRVLRETRIDELPQLINVLRGEMSLVGPRPEQPQYVARLQEAIPFYRLRHLGRPGLTGWAQLCCPYADSVDGSREKLQHDLYYLKNASPRLDLLILLQTAHAVLWGSGAR